MKQVAIVGAGGISVAHYNGWKQQPDASLALVVDADEGLARARSEEWGVGRWAKDYQVALEDPDIEAVDLCLPHHLHVPVATDFLRAGKHVLCEKPVARNLAELEALTQVVQGSRSIFMVAENWRHAPAAVKVEELLTAGTIGEPFMLKSCVEFRMRTQTLNRSPFLWRKKPELSGGGVLLDSGIHNVSLTRALLGDPESVIALRGKQVRQELAPIEESLLLLAKFPDGVIGTISFSWMAAWDKGHFDFTVMGSEGLLHANIEGGMLEVFNADRERTQSLAFDSNGFTEEIRHFLDCIATGSQPKTNVVTEGKAVKVVLAAYRSLESGRWERP